MTSEKSVPMTFSISMTVSRELYPSAETTPEFKSMLIAAGATL